MPGPVLRQPAAMRVDHLEQVASTREFKNKVKRVFILEGGEQPADEGVSQLLISLLLRQQPM
eukprot:scaffold250639_cov36-Tisochrysis_lutea.AAC.3